MSRGQRIIRLLFLAVICYLAYRQLSSVGESYGPFLSDDSLISYRYAERLAAGQGLTWNNGERVEGYSNLAWVLLLAAYRWAGGDLLRGGRVLGLACALLTFLALALAFRPRTAREGLAPLAGLYALATASPFVVWTTAGLEQPLLAAGLAIALALARADLDTTAVPSLQRHGLGAALFLLCWTRPDGALLAGAIFVAWALLRRKADHGLRAPLVVAAWPIVAVVSQLLFRIAYYHAIVPNTARAKLAFTWVRFELGLGYLRLATLVLWPVLAFAIVALVLALGPAKSTRKFGLFVLPFTLWLAYVACIGGDIFPAHRHFVPLLVLAAFAFAETVRLLAFFRRGAALGLGLLVLVPTLLSHYAKTDPQARRAVDERWEWDGQVVGGFLKKAFGRQAPLLAVDPAGCIPFFSGLPSIDMLGLNDRFLASHPPATFGTGYLGHELGDGAYVLDRKPDLVLFCSPSGSAAPCFRSGREMVRDPRWAEEYRPVAFETRTPRVVRSLTYLRTVGSKLGAREEDGRVVIPPYLFTGSKGVAVFDHGELVAELPPGTSIDLSITLPHPGRYKIDVSTNAPGSLRLGARSNGGAIDPSGEFDSSTPRATLALSVSQRLVLRGVALTPVP